MSGRGWDTIEQIRLGVADKGFACWFGVRDRKPRKLTPESLHLKLSAKGKGRKEEF